MLCDFYVQSSASLCILTNVCRAMNIILLLSVSGNDWEVSGKCEGISGCLETVHVMGELAPVWERLEKTGRLLPGLTVTPGLPGQHYFADEMPRQACTYSMEFWGQVKT